MRACFEWEKVGKGGGGVTYTIFCKVLVKARAKMKSFYYSINETLCAVKIFSGSAKWLTILNSSVNIACWT